MGKKSSNPIDPQIKKKAKVSKNLTRMLFETRKIKLKISSIVIILLFILLASIAIAWDKYRQQALCQILTSDYEDKTIDPDIADFLARHNLRAQILNNTELRQEFVSSIFSKSEILLIELIQSYKYTALEFNYLADVLDDDGEIVLACIDGKYMGNYVQFANHHDIDYNT
ncbi:hypothetical protein C2G38_2216491 [Gigaspora rosea]|uniref:Uncharacterized protein n=1 Tax=Gigaspora rosea TaxID=44941 RepID=A0A397UHS2_9GLOM|nr:hypothetical protein C2G38_2216491 [Gigaspora rosea]